MSYQGGRASLGASTPARTLGTSRIGATHFIESWITVFSAIAAVARSDRLCALFDQLTDEIRRLLLLAPNSQHASEIGDLDPVSLRAALGARDPRAQRDIVLAVVDAIHQLISDPLADDRPA